MISLLIGGSHGFKLKLSPTKAVAASEAARDGSRHASRAPIA
jgi:hypothetical protein